MSRLIPKTTAGRLIALVLIALVISQAISLGFLFGERESTLRGVAERNVLNRAVSVAGLVLSTPRDLHPAILRTANGRFLRFSLNDRALVDAADTSLLQQELFAEVRDRIPGFGGQVRVREGLRRFRRDMPRFLRENDQITERQRERRFRRWQRRSRRLDWLQASVELAPNTWLNIEAGRPPTRSRAVATYFISGLLTALLIGGLAVFAVRRITRPLKALSGAAEALGRGESIEPLPETGAPEIRQTAQAFNTMNARLTRFIQDRTQMLAAISHDLRTPLTTLRLRAELVEDAEIRARLIETVDEMQAMASETLAFARDDAAQENMSRVDLHALVDGICDDLQMMGRDVELLTEQRVTARCRSHALRRALRNLIENAVTYGQRARLRLETDGADATITIDDDGPGIPEEEIASVFKPFFRVEKSRSRKTGGVGLGLAIAQTIVHRHGGDVTLMNRLEGGLRVRVSIPR